MLKRKKRQESQKAVKPKPKGPRIKPREELVKNYTPKERPPADEEPKYNRLQQFDYVREVLKKNVWYYRDRLSVPRGPCTLPVMRECWVNGIIDENTLVWGQGLIDWLPAKNIRTLVCQIRTPEGNPQTVHDLVYDYVLVRFVTWMKKHLALKPELDRMRKAFPDKRPLHSDQVDEMY